MNDAHTALEAHHYPEAVDLLDSIAAANPNTRRALKHRSYWAWRVNAPANSPGQAEYQEYLQQYPQGAGAARVRARLQALAQASLAATPPASSAPPPVIP